MSARPGAGRGARRTDASSGASQSISRLLANDVFFEQLRSGNALAGAMLAVWALPDDADGISGQPDAERAHDALLAELRGDATLNALAFEDSFRPRSPATAAAAAALLGAIAANGAPAKVQITEKATGLANKAASVAMMSVDALTADDTFRGHCLVLFDRNELLRRRVSDDRAIYAILIAGFNVFVNDLVVSRRIVRTRGDGAPYDRIPLTIAAVGDDLVRCLCGAVHDDGKEMIQCDECRCWSHVLCASDSPGKKSLLVRAVCAYAALFHFFAA